MTDFADIKSELINRIDSLVHELAPGGRVNGSYYMAKNPIRDDRRPGSFWIRVRGSGVGVWRDEATGDGGDVVGLVKYVHGLDDGKALYQWCMAWLGWSDGRAPKLSNDERRRRQKEADARRRHDDARRAREADESARRAAGWWFNAEKDIAGTPVDTYLKSRGIDIAEMQQPPGAIRYLAKCSHHDSDGVITDWPAMFAAMCDEHGKIRAVHRTWLRSDGGGKAPVVPVKKIWPRFQGCMIRLNKGKGKLTPEQASKKGDRLPLIVTEGIEDGLTLALAKPNYRVWAAGTLGNIAHVPALPCISRLLVVADNDDHEPQAIQQFERAIAALHQRFDDVRVARAFVGKDVNQQLMESEL